MCRDRELLNFEVDPRTGTVESVRVLDEACLASGPKALPFVGVGEVAGSLESDVQHLLRRRALAQRRPDLPMILEAMGVESPTELAFLSRSCSLADQYWYRPMGSTLRWSDVNFFDNDWDPAFGEAVLSQDWQALARASVETPDVTCSGWMRKAWIREEGRTRLLKSFPADGASYLEGEIIATRLLSRILEPGEFIRYEKVRRFGMDCVACDLMLGSAEEHVSANCLMRPEVRRLYNEGGVRNYVVASHFGQVLESIGVEGASAAAAKVAVASSLMLDMDQHPFNYGVIRNVETGAYRVSPLFDYGSAFGLGSSPQDMQKLCDIPPMGILVGIRLFSELNSEWDYSWYDPQALEGFDEELEQALCSMDGLPAQCPKLVRFAFSSTLAYVNKVALGRTSKDALG